MCFDVDARPPDLPPGRRRIAGGAAAEPLILSSADGTRFAAAFAAAFSEPRDPGVIVLPDVRGLYRFYVELAERLAEAGHPAIAIDYFGRTAGAEQRGEDFDYAPHVARTSADRVQLDLAAARDALAERGSTSFVTLGFCFGGSHSFFAGTDAGLGLSGVIGFYGLLDPERVGRTERPSLLEHGAEIGVPVLGLFGGEDPSIPREDVEAFDRELDRAGVEHEIEVYPGAPHSFFDRAAQEHAEASADAWRRVLDFLERLG